MYMCMCVGVFVCMRECVVGMSVNGWVGASGCSYTLLQRIQIDKRTLPVCLPECVLCPLDDWSMWIELTDVLVAWLFGWWIARPRIVF
mmetsp:Transcript_6222/g.14996  ORF Transcript_6222/g.14996 Transcript_6222/m.14996 type:complete len:88 (-) Transcript_6222:313-576(-)